MSEMQAKYQTQPGKGALFAKADKDTGEIVRIAGNFVTPEGVEVHLDDCRPQEDGSIVLLGYITIGARRYTVSGYLTPTAYAAEYKAGELVVGKKTYKLNSKPVVDRNGLPYRFIWYTTNTVRAAF